LKKPSELLQDLRIRGTEPIEEPISPDRLSLSLKKNQLQEYCQKNRLNLPVYETQQSGPSHLPLFTVNGVYSHHIHALQGISDRKWTRLFGF
jgi:dsRNA-specific ribonuclease